MVIKVIIFTTVIFFFYRRGDVLRLVKSLNRLENKWEIMVEVWTEILASAAVQSNNVNHIKHIGEGFEYLSIVWYFLTNMRG